MKLSELKAQAAAVLAIPDTVGDFSNHSFTTRSGGAPSNRVGVPEVHRSEVFAYETQSCGDAMEGEVVVLCRRTEAEDKNGRAIHVTPDGIAFVYKYVRGSLWSFDGGALISPEL
jgi:hypothetical protein